MINPPPLTREGFFLAKNPNHSDSIPAAPERGGTKHSE